MKNSSKIQKQKITQTGSFVNWCMANNQTLPVVGKGATLLSWSDRHAYEVMTVSENGSECTIREYEAKRIDNNGMSECQEWEYKKLNPFVETIVWRKKQGGTWCRKIKEIRFIPKWIKEVHEKTNNFGFWKTLTKEQYAEIYTLPDGTHSTYPCKVVEGITKEYTIYSPVNIVFGVKDKYHDFSF